MYNIRKMAPVKQIKSVAGGEQENLASAKEGKSVKTRSSHIAIHHKTTSLAHLATLKKVELMSKRKADESPLKRATVKRTALADIKNHGNLKENHENQSLKTIVTKKSAIPTGNKKPLATLNIRKSTSVASVKGVQLVKVVEVRLPKPKVVEKITVGVREEACAHDENKKKAGSGVVTRRASRASELEKSGENSLYVSALEELNLDEKKSAKRNGKSATAASVRAALVAPRRKPPAGVDDFDAEQEADIGSVATYAMDIFNYLKTREGIFKVDDYMSRQTSVSKTMRALLVDWMVEIQENFELNHETLYLGVKIVDLYLSKVCIKRDHLQLIGCASLFLAAKYDERVPPLLEDFLYVCDNLYTAQDILSMEQKLLRALDFQLGMPLSYRFLRRYARCAKIDMCLLTLARYILEYSLMEYSLVTESESKLAAASLLLALQMKSRGTWTPTLEYYSGYTLEDIKDTTLALNECLHKKLKDTIKTIKTKYSHKVFFEVAKIPLLAKLEL